MKPEFRNVCEVIVKNDICIGCGLCAGVCPIQVLKMELNKFGEYQPVEFRSGCLPTCNLCLEVCPFWDRNKNENELGESIFSQQLRIQHRFETGYFLDSFVGYSLENGHRELGSSGGVTTWLLETLLEKKLVDKVICVGSTPDSHFLFKFRVCSTIDDCRNSSGSCYYPVEMSEVIQNVLSHEAKYAITGLPCYIKGLRLAMSRIPKLRSRISFLCGLVCSQNQSVLYAEQLCKLRGGDPSSMEKIAFRIKDPLRQADDYGFYFRCREGTVKEGSVFAREGARELFLNGYFTQNACQHCDDLFAETADITFMDAWLPEYKKDPKGHNLILVRSNILSNILNEGSNSHRLVISPIDIGLIIQSQKSGLRKKRGYLALRRSRKIEPHGAYRPRKREFLPEIEIEEKLMCSFREQIRRDFRSRFSLNSSLTPYAGKFTWQRLLIRLISKVSFFPKSIRKLKIWIKSVNFTQA